jgi:hypothetical protein
VRPGSHRFFVSEKTRVAPIQVFARPHGVSPFREELPRISSSVKRAKTRMDQHGQQFGGKRERGKNRSDVRVGDFFLMG